MLNWVEVDAAAIRHNLEEFRGHLDPSVRLGAVVKANAYGHGMIEVARIAAESGADWLCVNGIEEGLALRASGRTERVLVMGYVPQTRLDELIDAELTPVVYSLGTVDGLSEAARARRTQVRVHLKIETGTHRQGVPLNEAVEIAKAIDRAPGIDLEGIYTHFANIEDTTDHGFAEIQIESFNRIHDAIASVRTGPMMRHAACSAATLLFRQTHLDMVRLGISMYGIWPSRETRVSCRDRGQPTPDLRPALSWKTRIAQVKQVPEGSFVGYGCTYRTTRDSRIAVLPVGYSDGYDRGLGGVAHTLIRGRRAPVRGRICMNMCMVDVSDIDGVKVEDEVVLLGSQGDERIAAEQLAAWTGTIAYEIVARIQPGLPRVVTGNGA